MPVPRCMKHTHREMASATITIREPRTGEIFSDDASYLCTALDCGIAFNEKWNYLDFRLTTNPICPTHRKPMIIARVGMQRLQYACQAAKCQEIRPYPIFTPVPASVRSARKEISSNAEERKRKDAMRNLGWLPKGK